MRVARSVGLFVNNFVMGTSQAAGIQHAYSQLNTIRKRELYAPAKLSEVCASELFDHSDC